MIKGCLFALLLIAFCTAASPAIFGQAKPRLGILPFTGGTGGDGETIATLFSFQPDILKAFTVVPRTSAVNALVAEQQFQLSGYTDSDAIARLGRMLNADFVVSGFVRSVGGYNLVITTIVNVETFEQIAGDYREYINIEDIPALLPDVSRILINASRQDTSKLPKLAIVPFNLANTGANVQDAEALAQILSIEIGNAGKYIVLPRTTAIQAAMKELDYQMSGATAEEEAKALGRAINAEYVLNAEVRSLGTQNMFTGSILHVEDGSLLTGGFRNYLAITDGIQLMSELAGELTGTKPRAASVTQQQKPAKLPKQPKEAKPPKEAKQPKPPKEKKEKKEITPEMNKAARLWTVGVSAGSAFTDPVIIATVHGTIAPVRNLFIEPGCDIGFVSVYDDVKSYYSIYPYAHLGYFKPFSPKFGWYAGAGGGYMLGAYEFSGGKVPLGVFAADLITGVNIGNMIDISYTIKTNFSSASNKLSAGYVYRFK